MVLPPISPLQTQRLQPGHVHRHGTGRLDQPEGGRPYWVILSCTHWSVSPTMAHLEGEDNEAVSREGQAGVSCHCAQTQAHPRTGSPTLQGGQMTGETEGSCFSVSTAGTLGAQGGRSRTRTWGTALCTLAGPPLSPWPRQGRTAADTWAQASRASLCLSEPLRLPLSATRPQKSIPLSHPRFPLLPE